MSLRNQESTNKETCECVVHQRLCIIHCTHTQTQIRGWWKCQAHPTLTILHQTNPNMCEGKKQNCLTASSNTFELLGPVLHSHTRILSLPGARIAPQKEQRDWRLEFGGKSKRSGCSAHVAHVCDFKYDSSSLVFLSSPSPCFSTASILLHLSPTDC